MIGYPSDDLRVFGCQVVVKMFRRSFAPGITYPALDMVLVRETLPDDAEFEEPVGQFLQLPFG
jgi:hypothetical protein